MTITVSSWVAVALLLSLVFWAGYGTARLRQRRRNARRHPGYMALSRHAFDSGRATTGATLTPPGTSTASSGLKATAAVSIPGRETSRAQHKTSSPTGSGNASAFSPGDHMTGADAA